MVGGVARDAADFGGMTDVSSMVKDMSDDVISEVEDGMGGVVASPSLEKSEVVFIVLSQLRVYCIKHHQFKQGGVARGVATVSLGVAKM